MTSGTSINHENWNFVTTSRDSFFAQTHLCVLESMILAGDTKAHFKEELNLCRSKIKSQPETDISVYFSPVDGKEALDVVTLVAKSSKSIEAMSHRFSGAISSLL